MVTDNNMRLRTINVGQGASSHSSMVDLKIVTNLDWPAFRNVALNIQNALRSNCHTTVLDSREAKPGGKILFIETVRKDTLKLLKRILPGSNIVFYGTTEGHSFLDKESTKIAKNIKIVAVSNFVKKMLEEVGVPVVGVIHYGLDMDTREVDISFRKQVKEKLGEKLVILTIASNNPRKGLEKLLQAFRLVEKKLQNSFQVLHSRSKGYYDLSRMLCKLGIKRMLLTNRYGLLKSRELNALYDLSQIYVLSSFTEGFGLPMLEAFRFNKPIVAVDAPPFNEVVEDGRSGILIPCNDVRWYNYKNKVLFKMHTYEYSDLAEAIVNLLSNPSLLERITAYVRKNKHRWSSYNLYPKLLEYF